ncbi:pyridoxal phosphate-dependent aminotransferase [Candidatus Gracilibacteria bacterium]|nr:pyridoxal phosphate-dependent aminotransferase [Candidatus Gracilibacteria bacterium]
MRKNILHHGSKELSYEIRKIVEIAKIVENFGQKIIWENIGDPVAKGEKIPEWMKKIVQKSCENDVIYGYCPTKGLEETRKFLAKNNPKLNPENIIFFNGLGDAISKIYKNLAFDARIIGPNPAYSTHSSAEAAHAGSKHITYKLDPKNKWNPDLKELENKVKFNPNIVGILVVNPDNPTGAVFKKDVLEKIIKIAKKYELYVIFDEIYEKLIFDDKNKTLLSEIILDVPGISMKGMSKDLPWPGSRCGWIEVYNKEKDKNFSDYIDSVLNSKMLEVCSTTLPQKVLPKLYLSPEFEKYRKIRIEKYKQRADLAEKIFSDCEKIEIVKPKGAFYLSITFNMEKFSGNEKISLENKELQNFIDETIKNSDGRFDKKFCYYMLAKTGICSVPLSGFNSHFEGFRITLLEENLEKYEKILNTIKNFIKKF